VIVDQVMGGIPRFARDLHFGASERLVVSPGREERGTFHMPCGQSGHPLSPFYRKGHDDWVEGRPSPLLPGPPVGTPVVQPGH
jgi:penicillin amidase